MDISRRTLMAGSAALAISGCSSAGRITAQSASPEIGFESFDPKFADLIDASQSGQLLSTGHWWAEGPAWDRERQRLYFTDVPRNKAYFWSEKDGEGIFLSPSGVAPELAIGMREPGANGLLLGRLGELLICNHGRRALESRNFTTGERTLLADKFEGKRFNSPNDLIEASDGTIYFTDPPYGLEGLNESPAKEMEHNGVYRLDKTGAVTRIVDDMTLPNGVALSPGEKALYVSQSDPDAPLIRRFLLKDGKIAKGDGGEIWFDAKPYMHVAGGLPDGMAVSAEGYVFLGGPGGVLVIDPQGICLGRIGTGRATANCAFGEDGKTLFITAADRLVSVRTEVAGLGQF
ncbi:SMP-30/gluconolactonase/LRE family protein [Erythrobacter crassostreae]|uniref:SMP-30/gluconolactonase/LRE family protein n=1 Tax=Erythrobacter crassostreae TaxID=2828328 RepID=A0A9X1JLN1_9SPHN|nr:SMP-30/gluconolactonase/LRE family protein [Erythrobacter crassostrea]MBV7260335.1 SMP-30/gluconolactonase/LRE family protein [Erythrobacter crassostrea]